MRTIEIAYTTDAERIAIEQAVVYVKHLNQLAHTAPAGSVLKICEQAALDEGKKLLRSTLEAAVQARVDETEKKGAKPVSVQDVPLPDGIKVSTPGTC